MAEDMKQMAETVKLQQEQIASLIESIKNMPGVQGPVALTVQPAAVAPDLIRAEKVQRLAMSCQLLQNKW